MAIPTSCVAYNALTKVYTRLHNLGHLCAIASWDSAANMPPKGAEARGNALAEIALVMHGIKVDKKIKELIDLAEAEDLSANERANLREIKLDWTVSAPPPEPPFCFLAIAISCALSVLTCSLPSVS